MDHTLKLNRAKEYLHLLKANTEKDILEETFLKHGMNSEEINEIKHEALNLLKQEYALKIKKHLLNVNLQNHLDEFPLIDEKEFEALQHQEHRKLIKFYDEKVETYYQEKKTIDEIEILVANPYYDRDDIEKQIAKSHLKDQVAKDEKSPLFVIASIFLILAGICFIFFELTGISSVDGWFMLMGIGAIVLGIKVYYVG